MAAPLQLQDLINDRERDEAAFVLARPSVIAFIPTALIFTFIMAFSYLFQVAIRFNLGRLLVLPAESANAVVLAIALFQLMALIVLMVMILDFYFDIMVVTERRIIQIDHRSLFFRDTAELSLEDVESVSTVVPHMFASFLSFGNITVETAAEITRFNMQNLRYPSEIVYIINDLAQQAKNKVPENKRVPQTSILAVINEQPIRTLEEMKRIGAISPDDMRHIHDPQSPAERRAVNAQPQSPTNTPPNTPPSPFTPFEENSKDDAPS